jgi:hypothetical protein
MAASSTAVERLAVLIGAMGWAPEWKLESADEYSADRFKYYSPSDVVHTRQDILEDGAGGSVLLKLLEAFEMLDVDCTIFCGREGYIGPDTGDPFVHSALNL